MQWWNQSRRLLHTTYISFKSEGGRPTSWNLPDLDKLMNNSKSKVYSKNDWNEYFSKETITGERNNDSSKLHIKPPPKGWRKNKNLPQWLREKYALKEKAMKIDLSKVKRLSPSTANAIRMLHDQFPEELPTPKLAEFFKVSPVAIAKILKSRWTPTEKELEKLERRYQRRLLRQVTEKMLHNKFEEFIAETESKLKMEIPPFFKQELFDYYKKFGIEEVRTDFEELNKARLAREKRKDEKINEYVNTIAPSTEGND
ncbi:uncharacterized protein C5L36_0A09310 [Pichia kudriavzevii]|uniref:Required for respiratory growth protein 9, mitochondrial n=1 Tax=Pichia kudriavzevii TaxID=4909 RepID=A0A2U9QZL7_PICKU|nr:uncharacterized protein C5L36_0A09310 [Pichia kudriavzevii]AWU74338.1 hypothetical protein C5L36_0A09310 [Pichia kudriavzevii]